MKPRLIVLRPEPGASQTVARATARGWAALAVPLFTVRPCPWEPADPAEWDAVRMTSANAARHGGAGLAALRALPLYAVGEATAAAAREAGFAEVRTGRTDGAALVARAAADGIGRLLHLAGRERRAVADARLTIGERIVYAAEAAGRLPDAELLAGSIVLIHSPRAALVFAGLVEQAGIARGRIALAAISPAAAEGLGTGWAGIAIAERPGDDALLAAASALCDQG
jgi:uroporphyrinogen-III synthase